MTTITKSLMAAGWLLLAGTASAGCTFSWHHYGDNAVRDLINPEIGAQVPDTFCPHKDRVEIVLITDALQGRDGCFGSAVGGLRKKGSDAMITKRTSYLVNNVQCSNTEEARRMAKDAAISVVKDLMTNLNDEIQHLKSRSK